MKTYLGVVATTSFVALAEAKSGANEYEPFNIRSQLQQTRQHLPSQYQQINKPRFHIGIPVEPVYTIEPRGFPNNQ